MKTIPQLFIIYERHGHNKAILVEIARQRGYEVQVPHENVSKALIGCDKQARKHKRHLRTKKK